MDHPFTERRRSPRIATANGTMAVRPVSMPVRLLDISSDGLMLACPRPLTVAATPRVVSWLAGRRLEVELVVRHVSSQWVDEAGGYVAGGRFPALDPRARLVIDALLAASARLAVVGPASQAGRGRSRPPLGDEAPGETPARRRARPRIAVTKTVTLSVSRQPLTKTVTLSVSRQPREHQNGDTFRFQPTAQKTESVTVSRRTTAQETESVTVSRRAEVPLSTLVSVDRGPVP